MKSRTAAFLIVLAVVAVSIGWWLRGFVATDACLDHGGSWDSGGYCAGANRS